MYWGHIGEVLSSRLLSLCVYTAEMTVLGTHWRSVDIQTVILPACLYSRTDCVGDTLAKCCHPDCYPCVSVVEVTWLGTHWGNEAVVTEVTQEEVSLSSRLLPLCVYTRTVSECAGDTLGKCCH